MSDTPTQDTTTSLEPERASAPQGERLVVGAVIVNGAGRAFIQRRSEQRALYPGCWDIVGGHVDPGETVEDALARELHEETGWTLRRIVALVSEFSWGPAGERRRELDYLVEVDGNLDAPELEWDKHPEFRWVAAGELDILRKNGAPGDELMHSVAEGLRIAGRNKSTSGR